MILWIVVVFIVLTVINACIRQNNTTTEIDVLYDVTDAQLSQPDVEEILSLYDLQNKWDGAVFRFAKLTDVSYNQLAEAILEAKNEWLSNELERDKEIKNFKNEVAKIIANSETGTIGKSSSSIYLPIARELNELSKSKADKRVLVVYSDLMENTSDLSFYRKRDFELLKSNPDQVRKKLEKLTVLNSLTGIEIYFIYQPSETKGDQSFQTVTNFYKKLFEDKGAKVTVSANLNF
jgi:hypothetical protein